MFNCFKGLGHCSLCEKAVPVDSCVVKLEE